MISEFAFADDAVHAAFGDEGRQPLRSPQRGDRMHDVAADGSRAEQPAEQRTQRRNLAVHRGGAHAARFGAVENPFADVVRGDPLRFEPCVVDPQPREELLHVVAVVADRERRVAAFGFEVSDEIGDHT